MKKIAGDGKPFTEWEQVAYDAGFQIGANRKSIGELMGSSYKCGFRGRNRLIFNEGLEDGYSSSSFIK